MSRSPDFREGLKRIRDPGVCPDSHHYIALSQLNAWLASSGTAFARGVLFDYGCGGQPYKALFANAVTQYIGADVATAANTLLDVELTPGGDVPMTDASVDTILSTQTLEHVFDFKHYLNECRRLLRPQGRLIITVPMQWRHHEVPYDYWRFTRYGLEKALHDASFEVIEMLPCGGVYSLLGQIYLSHLAETGKARLWLNRLINRVALWLDRRCQDHDDTLLWLCLAEKRF